MEDYLWIRWEGNGNKANDGKVHKMHRDTLVDKRDTVQVGDEVEVYWPYGKKHFGKGEYSF